MRSSTMHRTNNMRIKSIKQSNMHLVDRHPIHASNSTESFQYAYEIDERIYLTKDHAHMVISQYNVTKKKLKDNCVQLCPDQAYGTRIIIIF